MDRALRSSAVALAAAIFATVMSAQQTPPKGFYNFGPDRTPPKYVVPKHNHTSDEMYVWLKGAFTYVAADGTRHKIEAPAYTSLPG
jgi:uncharacterized protein (DUF39 family)